MSVLLAQAAAFERQPAAPRSGEVPPMVGFRLICARQVGKVKGVSEGLN